jgi:hypothetical protein
MNISGILEKILVIGSDALEQHSPEKFSAGDEVGCYFGVVFTMGTVESVAPGKVVVKVEFNRYEDNDISRRTTEVELLEYIRREKDGLYVSASSLHQYVPESMMIAVTDIGPTNQWRYSPSLLERLKRLTIPHEKRGYRYVQEKPQKREKV